MCREFKIILQALALAVTACGPLSAGQFQTVNPGRMYSPKEWLLDREPDKEKIFDLSRLKHPVKPILWKFRKRGAEQYSYLFGTVHLNDPRVTTLHPSAQKAFDRSQRFYTEVAMTAASEKEAHQAMRRTDRSTMSKSLGATLTKIVNAELARIDPKYSVKMFDPMKTWLMVLILPQLEGKQKGGASSLDWQLWNRALKAKKIVGGLETATEQMAGMNNLPERDQVALVKATVEMRIEARRERIEIGKDLVDLYLEGSGPKLSRYFKSSFKEEKFPKSLIKKYRKSLVLERNVRIAENIDKAVQSHPDDSHFFAIGAAHYLNDKSVRYFLARKGYVVTRAHAIK